MSLKIKHKNCNCSGVIEQTKELVFFNGKKRLANASKCKKCNAVYFSPQETDRVRKLLNPTFTERIIDLFNYDKVTEN